MTHGQEATALLAEAAKSRVDAASGASFALIACTFSEAEVWFVSVPTALQVPAMPGSRAVCSSKVASHERLRHLEQVI